jgi:hypothetical protein
MSLNRKKASALVGVTHSLLALANTLTLYVTKLFTSVKSFMIQTPGAYSQHFIFFTTYEQAQ